jgi:hypothetical protein
MFTKHMKFEDGVVENPEAIYNDKKSEAVAVEFKYDLGNLPETVAPSDINSIYVSPVESRSELANYH